MKPLNPIEQISYHESKRTKHIKFSIVSGLSSTALFGIGMNVKQQPLLYGGMASALTFAYELILGMAQWNREYELKDTFVQELMSSHG